jgi:hypothetical protein
MRWVAARQIKSRETIHPAKLSALGAVKQESVNHSEPNVTSKGTALILRFCQGRLTTGATGDGIQT